MVNSWGRFINRVFCYNENTVFLQSLPCFQFQVFVNGING